MDSFERARSLLLTSPEFAGSSSHVLAFASINYRLSPHPDFPQDGSTTPQHSLRNAKHPDHIQDVEKAIAYLQQKYNFGSRYVLAGHSCGATLAFQAAMRPLDATLETKISRPMALAGAAGIYDLRALRVYHKDDREVYQIYQGIIEVPFGADETLWDKVSPVKFRNDTPEGNRDECQVIVLAHSKNDQLVDAGQLQAMEESLAGWEDEKNKVGNRKVVTLTDLEESHQRMWSEGQELAKVIAVTVDELQKLQNSH